MRHKDLLDLCLEIFGMLSKKEALKEVTYVIETHTEYDLVTCNEIAYKILDIYEDRGAA